MRVITGTARGTNLKTPEGMNTRPTADRVKEALFNVIQYEIRGEVLDLFAGTGQLGIEALSRGAAEAGKRFGVSVIGGDLASLPAEGEVASLTILGEADAAAFTLRSGAKPGDLLYVTGEIGNSLASGHHLDFEPRLAEGRFLAENGFASAMLDISDGLLLDAERLAKASRLRLCIDPAAVPLRAGAERESALSDGEDYELLFTVPPGREEELKQVWKLTKLTRIGVAEPGEPDVCDCSGRSLLRNGKCGYEH